MSTIEGMARMMRQGIRYNHPEVTPEEIQATFVSGAVVDEARIKFEIINNCGDEAVKEKKDRRKK